MIDNINYMEINEKMSILVLSFDGYSDVWDAFFKTKAKYWTSCSYKTRLVSNYKTYPNVETINVGDEVCWSDRALKALEFVSEPYVMLLLEDYLFSSHVNDEQIVQAIDYMINNSLNYMRIVTIPKSRFSSEADGNYVPIYQNEEYGVNLQASIWKTSYLQESIRQFYGSPWDFEIGFLSKTIAAEPIPMPGCFSVNSDLIEIKNGVLKGKWFPSVIKFYNKEGLLIDWKYRGKLSKFEEFNYNIKVGLKNKLGYKTRRIVKKCLTFLGVQFVSKL